MAETRKRIFHYETEIDIEAMEVRTIFLGETNTFAFDDHRFPLAEALKVAAECAHKQLHDMLRKMTEHVERREERDESRDL